MKIEIVPILHGQKSVFIQMMNLYNYDFTEYEDVDLNECGYFDYSYTDHWWTEENRHPFFIRVDGKLAGFVLVKAWLHDSAFHFVSGEHAFEINEFFVMKKYRRMGVGSSAATAAFDLLRGQWEVCQLPNNFPAQKFWRSVITQYTDGHYREGRTEDGKWVGFVFDNSREG